MENELPKRKDIRLKNYNYSSEGAYFVTICTQNRTQILSNVIKPVGVGALPTKCYLISLVRSNVFATRK